jgi:hypothetical protein
VEKAKSKITSTITIKKTKSNSCKFLYFIFLSNFYVNIFKDGFGDATYFFGRFSDVEIKSSSKLSATKLRTIANVFFIFFLFYLVNPYILKIFGQHSRRILLVRRDFAVRRLWLAVFGGFHSKRQIRLRFQN